jgi:dTDP-4-amino-4,6-dideoxygalactose transaminase
MNVPFLDLKRELIPLNDQIQKALNATIEKCDFVLGEDVDLFEQNFSTYIGSKYCIGVANGTDALEIAVKCLDLPPDSEIITQANTYVATCLGAINNNYPLKLVDIDPLTYQMDLQDLESSIHANTKAVIIVHMYGQCCDMEKLMHIINKHNLILIEDCAQSHGGQFKNKKLGTYGYLSTFSFYPSKNLGAFGDGGAICTNDHNTNILIRKLRNNGCIVKYHHDIQGRNSRLDTIQAAVLNIKLVHLNNNNDKRRNNANYYRERLHSCKYITMPYIVDGCTPVYHLFLIKVKEGISTSIERNALKDFLQTNGIGIGIHYPVPIYKVDWINQNDRTWPHTEQHANAVLSLPMYPDLTHYEIDCICDLIHLFYKNSHRNINGH